jgi:ribosomal protein S18 acetylase RimI-like enzyme
MAIMTTATSNSRKGLEVVDFAAHHAGAFHDLNIEWLERYFSVEPIDRIVLSDPQRHLIDPGGDVLMACQNHQPVGCCALKYHASSDEFELTKMAVTPDHQGLGIGALLMEAVIERYRAHSARGLFLETNSILQPAIRLYQRFGFVQQPKRRQGSPYMRSNVYMIWNERTGNPDDGQKKPRSREAPRSK